MSNLNVRFNVNFSARFVRWVLIGVMLFASASELASENVTLTTYYPAPSGVYTLLIATSNSFMARDSGYLDVGTNAPPPAGIKLSVAGPGSFISPHMGTTGGVIIRDASGDPNAAYLQFTNNADTVELGHIQGLQGGGLSMMGGNVGLGTTAPASSLSVNGGVQMGYDASACTGAKVGTQRWNSWTVQLEVCNGTSWVPASSQALRMMMTSYTRGGGAGGVATCPPGTALASGGVSCGAPGTPFVLISYPANSSQWYAQCGSLSNAVWGTGYPVTANVYALCR